VHIIEPVLTMKRFRATLDLPLQEAIKFFKSKEIEQQEILRTYFSEKEASWEMHGEEHTLVSDWTYMPVHAGFYLIHKVDEQTKMEIDCKSFEEAVESLRFDYSMDEYRRGYAQVLDG